MPWRRHCPRRNLTAANGATPGSVVLSWDAVDRPSCYRIGHVAMPSVRAAIDSGRPWHEAFEGLTEMSWLTNRVEPSLARSWVHSDDGLTWTFLLREDVRWHDGTPFTAHDVDFTFNRIIYNDDIPASSRPSFTFRVQDDAKGESRDEQIAVTALNDHTVQIVLPTSFAPRNRRPLRRARAIAVVPEPPVPPGGGPPHRQGNHHRRRAARPRLSPVVIDQPGRRRLSQPQRAPLRIQRQPGAANAGRSGLARY